MPRGLDPGRQFTPGDHDKTTGWLIRHLGGVLLRLAGLDDIVIWRALQGEVVLPRKLPDGVHFTELRGRGGAR